MILALLFAAAVQCPDGSPPPCARAAAPAAPAIDQRRIAILPFRVTATDTLYGAGIAELLSNQVGTDDQLRATHMGTVLRAWRRAGGSMQAPLDQSAVQRVARELGAGRIVDGSVVSLGPRLTLTANVTTLPAGTSRRVGPFSGPADSLEAMIGRLASGLLGATGGGRVDLQVRMTDSPDAMRAYLEGLAHFRARNMPAAGAAFERAFGLDSTFARAVWMRYVASTWGWNQGTLDAWSRQVFRLRSRLSPQDQILVTSLLGEGSPRSPAQILADRERAVALLPENPEALYQLGDYLFHGGAAHDRSRRLFFRQAAELFAHSLALDTQATVVQHLLDVALLRRDTAGLRTWWPVYDRIAASGGNPAGLVYGLIVSEVTGDPGIRTAALRRAHEITPNYRSYAAGRLYYGALGAEASARIYNAFPDQPSPPAALAAWAHSLIRTGHPSELAGLRRTAPDSGIAGYLDYLTVVSAALGEIDSTLALDALARLRALTATTDTRGLAHVQCATALWDQRIGPARYDSATVAVWLPTCTAALALAEAWRSRAPDLDRRITVLDSMLRDHIANTGPSEWWENRILARVHEARGDRRAALGAIRLRLYAFGTKWSDGGDLRIEGRLAALQGDTADAIESYERYLNLRRDAEPSLMPRRDSVAAELAALRRRS